ncbi:cell division protein SepF [bacterium]|nr:cell division protein SepF [bacterium]
MSFLNGVWRMLGAEDEHEHETMLEYPGEASAVKSYEPETEAERIISMPEVENATLFVVRPALDDHGGSNFSLKQYAAYLMTRQAMVLDVNELAAKNMDEARRVVDYLCGVVAAVDGTVWEVTRNIFIFAPSTVALAGDKLRQIEVS